MVKIISFSGGISTGKDTFGNVYKNLIENKNNKVLHYSFAGPLKNEVNELIELIRNNSSFSIIKNKFHDVSDEDLLLVIDLIQSDLETNPYLNSTDRTPNIRKVLQFWGTDVRRKSDENYWVNKGKEAILDAVNNNKYVYITDSRFTNELEMLKEIGAKLILLEVELHEQIKRVKARDGLDLTIEMITHPSETDHKKYDGYDYTINTTNLNSLEIEGVLLKIEEIF